MELMKSMTASEVLNLIEWLKAKNFSSDDIVDCIEAVAGKKKDDLKENGNSKGGSDAALDCCLEISFEILTYSYLSIMIEFKNYQTTSIMSQMLNTKID